MEYPTNRENMDLHLVSIRKVLDSLCQSTNSLCTATKDPWRRSQWASNERSLKPNDKRPHWARPRKSQITVNCMSLFRLERTLMQGIRTQTMRIPKDWENGQTVRNPESPPLKTDESPDSHEDSRMLHPGRGDAKSERKERNTKPNHKAQGSNQALNIPGRSQTKMHDLRYSTWETEIPDK